MAQQRAIGAEARHQGDRLRHELVVEGRARLERQFAAEMRDAQVQRPIGFAERQPEHDALARAPLCDQDPRRHLRAGGRRDDQPRWDRKDEPGRAELDAMGIQFGDRVEAGDRHRRNRDRRVGGERAGEDDQPILRAVGRGREDRATQPSDRRRRGSARFRRPRHGQARQRRWLRDGRFGRARGPVRRHVKTDMGRQDGGTPSVRPHSIEVATTGGARREHHLGAVG